MGRRLLAACAGLATLVGGGCGFSGPLVENPVLLRPVATGEVENPVYVPLGTAPDPYAKVWENVLDIVTHEFPDHIAEANRYAGEIKTYPTVQKPFTDWLATFQSIRRYAIVKIDAAQDRGYWVDVKVYKELEDLRQPIRVTAGAAVFRSDPTVEREFEVIEPTTGSGGWIPIGEDVQLEQEILAQIKKCL